MSPPPGQAAARGRRRRTPLTALLLIAPAHPVACPATPPEACRAEPREAVVVFLEDTDPVYSRGFTGTLESASPPEGVSPGQLTVRREDGTADTILYFQPLAAGIRFPVGQRLRFQVERVAGFPSLYGITISDERGLVLAAASDLWPGRNVLREGVAGFGIEFGEPTCSPRLRGACYEEITNLPLRFTHDGSSLELMQGESGRIGEFQVDCRAAQRVVYSERCADAGAIAVSYLIARADIVEAAR